MPRCRNGDQLGVERDRLVSGEYSLDGSSRASDVSLVQDPLASEATRKELVLRDVVAMRQEHGLDAASKLEFGQETPDAARRIDEDVPSRPLDEVTPGAERVLGGETAEEDVFVDPLGEPFDARTSVATRPGSDRSGRTGDQSHQGAAAIRFGFRLLRDEGVIVGGREDTRGDPPAGIAVDAGPVHVEVARSVVRKALSERGHRESAVSYQLSAISCQLSVLCSLSSGSRTEN